MSTTLSDSVTLTKLGGRIGRRSDQIRASFSRKPFIVNGFFENGNCENLSLEVTAHELIVG